MYKYLGISSLLLVISFLWAGAFSNAHAHGGEAHSASYNLASAHLAQDTAVDPASLGVGTTDVLPGHPFYFFKNATRGFRSAFAFSVEKKAELKLQFANEKIVEAQLLLDRGDKNRAAKHLVSYEKDLARAVGVADKEKFIVQSIRHQAVMDKIEREASEEQIADVKSVREKSIEHVAEAVASIEDKEEAKNALILATSDGGSAFKPLRNLEVLKAVEEKVPEQAKEAIRAAQENAVKRFKSDYEKATDEEKEALTDYIKGAGGDASRYLEAFRENKEVLGEELSQKLLSAGEEKRTPIVPPSSSIPTVAPPSASPAPKKTSAPAPKPASQPVPEKSSAPVPQETPAADTETDTGSETEPKPYEGSPPLLY